MANEKGTLKVVTTEYVTFPTQALASWVGTAIENGQSTYNDSGYSLEEYGSGYTISVTTEVE